MKIKIFIVALLSLSAWSTAVAGEIYDGSKNLICASIEAIDCVAGEPCFKALPEAIGAPQFMNVNFEEQVIVGPKRTTPVLSTTKNEEQILLRGTELDMGWVFALDQVTGKFSATLTNMRGAFVIFGACTSL